MRWLLLAWIILGMAAPPAGAEKIAFTSDRWVYDGTRHSLETHLGRECLLLKGGIAWIRDIDFADGTIEFDLCVGSERAFAGAVFRMQDDSNYEDFYIRPHQSGNPDATQYTPVFHGLAGWQLYHGPGFNGHVTCRFDEWVHVKIVIAGDQAEVYYDAMTRPILFIHDLKSDQTHGRIGLKVHPRTAPARFADFEIHTGSPPALKGRVQIKHRDEPGTLARYAVSSSFDFRTLADADRLDPATKAAFTWNPLTCESDGLANVARLRTLARGQNAVFLRTTITSPDERIVELDFGFSDMARVYLNDELLYQGNDTYRSRDYRFLGSIGYFDRLALHLRPGANELWIAVAESFGGWGVRARLVAAEGLTCGPN